MHVSPLLLPAFLVGLVAPIHAQQAPPPLHAGDRAPAARSGPGLLSRATKARHASAGGSHAATLAPSGTPATGALLAPPANDPCASPTTVVGTGPFAFTTSTATTGPEGQSEARCAFFGSAAVPNDVWYCWTAPSTGSFDVSTLGSASLDTKIAVYDGCGCPLNPAIGCNDDACGYGESNTTFQAVAGHAYTVQIGSTPTGSGSFTITPTPPNGTPCRRDDGVSENTFGPGTPATHLVWMQVLGEVGVPTLVTSVSAAYGTPAFPGFAVPLGRAVDVLVWEDPNDDGNPVDAVLVHQGAAAVGSVDLDVFDVYPTPPLVLQGRFLVGIGMVVSDTEFPASADDNLGCVPGLTGWYVGDDTGPVDYDDLDDPGYLFPLTDSTIAFFGHWMLRAGCTTRASTDLCGNGDPLRIACPCGNDGANPLGGCANSLPASTGATQRTSGFQATDDVVLTAQGMSGSACLFFASTGAAVPAGVFLGDGVACTGATLVRLRTVSFTGGLAGMAQLPAPADTTTLSAISGTTPGSGARIQYCTFYRNAAAFCTPFTFNVTDTDEIVW